jgi:hypothetical protein
MDNQAPMRRIEKDNICFLIEQYGKFQANDIFRYVLLKNDSQAHFSGGNLESTVT